MCTPCCCTIITSDGRRKKTEEDGRERSLRKVHRRGHEIKEEGSEDEMVREDGSEVTCK